MSGFSDPRAIHGIHSFTPYDRTTGLPYGEVRVLEDSTLSLQGEIDELMGGSSKYSWAVEDGAIQAEISLKAAQYDDFMFTLFLGTAPTANNAETGGSVNTLANTKGTSVKQATTGIASVGIKSGSETDVKFGRYIVKCVTSTTVDVYVKSDVDLARGTDKDVQDDLLKITATPLTITASTPVDIPGFGLQLTGGSGTIGMTVGDTAEFQARPINAGYSTVRIGGRTTTTFPEFGAVVVAQKRGNQEMLELDIFRCKAAGMPIGFTMNAWSKYEIKIKVMYDSAKAGIFDLTHIKPTATS